MNIQRVRERIQEIHDNEHDVEEAHFLEDKLIHDFIRDVANGSPARAVAQIIVGDLFDMPRTRWYA
jgi:hypothetical protein